MWGMTRNTSVSLNRSVLINERTLLVCVTLNARGVRAGGKSCLFQLKAAVWVMTITALHRSFKNFVMEGQIELMFGFAMTTDAELRLIHLQQSDRRYTRLLRVRV